VVCATVRTTVCATVERPSMFDAPADVESPGHIERSVEQLPSDRQLTRTVR
jgi:hypothetical protein